MNNPPVILWFRNDLRINDNPALNNALKISKNENRKIICIYILENYKDFSSNPGSASKWWLHGSLKKLDQQLTKLNEEQVSSSLNFFVGRLKKSLTMKKLFLHLILLAVDQVFLDFREATIWRQNHG